MTVEKTMLPAAVRREGGYSEASESWRVTVRRCRWPERRAAALVLLCRPWQVAAEVVEGRAGARGSGKARWARG